MSDVMPKISVVICTRNRSQEIGWALSSVLENTGLCYEVIVVDQSDGEDTARLITGLQGRYAHLRYVPTATRGLSKARNIGVAEARAEIIAFTDDDCETGTDWVTRIYDLFASSPELGLVYGQVLMPKELPEGVVVPCLHFHERRLLSQGVIFGMGANMAFRRSLFDRLGGYDTLLGAGGPFGGGEDFDFTYRVQRAGAVVAAEPSLHLIHRSFRERSQWRQVQIAYGRGDAAFQAKHARCGDFKFLRTICFTILSRGVRGLVKTVLRRHNPEAVYVRGFCHGIRASLRYAVDRRTRLYVGG